MRIVITWVNNENQVLFELYQKCHKQKSIDIITQKVYFAEKKRVSMYNLVDKYYAVMSILLNGRSLSDDECVG